MGGFLSALYAMLCFAYIERKCVMPVFVKLGLPGGIKRYLDDVLVCIGCMNEEVLQAMEFVRWVQTAYPPPLVPNFEPSGDQEFLEAKVSSEVSVYTARC